MCSFFSSVLGSSTLFNAVVSNVIVTDTGPLSIRNFTRTRVYTGIDVANAVFFMLLVCICKGVSISLYSKSLALFSLTTLCDNELSW
jgi:hypothetical protein